MTRPYYLLRIYMLKHNMARATTKVMLVQQQAMGASTWRNYAAAKEAADSWELGLGFGA